MGQAIYYLKALFETEDKATEACFRMVDFVRQGQQAYEYWQRNRRLPADEFWTGFEKSFPAVFDYLGGERLADGNNSLAGMLDFGREDETPEVQGREIWFSAYVWHCASWGLFEQWIYDHLHALDVVWNSDEHINPFDALHY